MKIETGGPAFPSIQLDDRGEAIVPAQQGMTLRDYLAAAALPHCCDIVRKAAEARIKELLRGDPARENDNRTFQQTVAQEAYRIADAMIEARNQ